MTTITAATSTTIDKKVNANSEHGDKNRRPGPVNTNWGDKVGICKPRVIQIPQIKMYTLYTKISWSILNLYFFPGIKENAGGSGADELKQ